jgi:hypothetical protein
VNSKYVVGHPFYLQYGGSKLREYQSKNPNQERLENREEIILEKEGNKLHLVSKVICINT